LFFKQEKETNDKEKEEMERMQSEAGDYV